MAFAQTDAAEQDDVGFGVQKGQAHEIHDVGAIEFLGPGPIEGVERLQDGEAGGLEAPLNADFAAAVAFAFQNSFEIAVVGFAVLGGFLGEGFVVLEAPGELEFFEIVAQVAFHGGSLG